MFVFGRSTKGFAAVFLVAVVAFATVTAPAQTSTRRQRRETNANRRARINRTIQDTYTRRYELFGGGGYLRFRSGEYLRRNNEVTWATSGTYFLNEKLGITADLRGAYGNAKISNVFAVDNVFDPLINEYSFMGGATYRVYLHERYAVSVLGAGGIALGNFNGGSRGVDSPTLGMWKSTDRPVVSVGLNLDYNFYPNLAFRVTPTVLGTMFVGTTSTASPAIGGSQTGGFQPNLGFNAGIVYRFGRIR